MIRCKTNGKFYIGGTKMPFDKRFSCHRSQLGRGRAPRLLQACHDLYGLADLEFSVLREFPPEEVADREREAIDTLKPELNIFGVRPKANAPRPVHVDGKDLTVAEAADRYGLEIRTINARLARGVRGDDLVAKPHRGPRKPYTPRHR